MSETILTQEITKIPKVEEAVSDLVEKVEEEKSKEIIEKNTKDQLWESIGWLSQRLTNPPHKDPDKKEQVEHLKKELEIEKQPLVETIVDHKKTKEEKTEKKHIHEHHKEKSESKLWEKTKKVLNRPLEHTWVGKHLIQKSIDWVKKLLKRK